MPSHYMRSSMMRGRFHPDEPRISRVTWWQRYADPHGSFLDEKPRTPDLVVGACILIGLAFVVFWLLDGD